MDPKIFKDPETRAAYTAAQKIPHIIEQLFCYCGCDVIGDEYLPVHHSLLDCFVTPHSRECSICRKEALKAYKMHEDGLSLKTIQKRLHEQHSAEYPFGKGDVDYPESDIYKRYKQKLFGGAEPADQKSPATGHSSANSRAPKQEGGCCGDKKKP